MSDPFLPQSKITAPRRIWSLIIAALIIGGAISFVIAKADRVSPLNSTAGKTPQTAPQTSPNESPEKTNVYISRPATPEEAALVEAFRRQCKEVKRLDDKYMEERALFFEKNPVVTSALLFRQRIFSFEIDKHGKSKQALQRYGMAHQEKKPVFDESDEIAKPLALADMLAAGDPIGGTTLGAITKDLVASTDYFDVIKKDLIRLEESRFPTDSDAARLKVVNSPEALISELERLRPKYQQRQQLILAEGIPAEHREALMRSTFN